MSTIGVKQVAVVRIAPIEHWCEGFRASADMHKLVGMEIEIVPSSMKIMGGGRYHSEPCRWWALTERAKTLIEDITGLPDPDDGLFVCEHLFEMD
jgi:hypothetical protein